MKTRPSTSVFLVLASTVAATAALAATGPPAEGALRRSVAAITVCSPDGMAGRGSCPSGSFDTLQVVVGPSGGSIDSNGVHAASDEHASVFPPGSLGNGDYLFFVAAGTDVNPDIGVVVLSGGSGPDSGGQWTMDFAPEYGSYSQGFGTVFLEPIVEGRCPSVADPTQQDQTFDLDYAAAGSVVPDPTDRPGHLLMIYEGANTCVGNGGGRKSGTGAYITTGVATSIDDGHTWPSYRGTATFGFVPLPQANRTEGPNAPSGALGAGTCFGTDCTQMQPATYGRYAVLSPPLSLATLTAAGQPLTDSTFDSEPSAFVDDASPGPVRYLYEVHRYGPGNASPASDQLPDGRSSDLTVARAELNGGTAPLRFAKWGGHGFSAQGIGGHEVAILPDGAFANCGDLRQSRSQGSISCVDDTQQYLLTFMCDSPGDPAGGAPGGGMGSAWFWATTRNLADETTWSTPQEIQGTWMPWDTGTPPGSYGCPSYMGWYPTLMSLAHAPGHLTTSGYVFAMWGCLGGSNANPPTRKYSSRRFEITTESGIRRKLERETK
jgi:hypothetical protein